MPREEDIVIDTEETQLQPISGQLTGLELAQNIVKLEALKKEVAGRLEEMRSRLLVQLQEQDVMQIKTGSYTISKARRITTKVTDQIKAIEFLKPRLGEANVMTKLVLDMDYMKPVLDGIIEEGGTIDGVEQLVTEYPIVRLAKEKK